MKDAFGGSFMLYILSIFFVIFICFMTVAINFAKTFRIKNAAVNYIERYGASSLDDAITKIETLETNIAPGDIGSHCSGTLTSNSICIIPMSGDSYYKVYAYIVMNFPLFNSGIVIPIGGETKIINFGD